MNRQQIVAEIRRIALDNGGRAPGHRASESATGIKESDWYPHIWLRWGDAVTEAGYAANEFTARISDEVLIERYVGLARELGRFPLEGEIRRKSRSDDSFPSEKTFRRFGGKHKLLAAVAAYCRKTLGFEDILPFCVEQESVSTQASTERRREAKLATGFVYLMKSGPHYKIGRTNSVGRRGSELAIKIPVPPTTVHSIETDDPVGVESYWHRRFADKRGEGEWFALSLEDVKAFKRWKRII
jgi:hypothetical protein